MKSFDERKASVGQYMSKIQKKRRRTIVGVTSLVLVVSILALVLFVPYDTTPPDVRMYADNEYYDLIQRLNELSYEPPEHKNNYQAVLYFLRSAGRKTGDAIMGTPQPNMGATMAGDAVVAPGDAFGSGTKGEQYEEVTDNQVQGVIEADIFKRSDKYVFYLREAELSVYSIAQEESHRVGTYTIRYEEGEAHWDWVPKHYLNSTEMYLSDDCSTVTIVLQGYHENYKTTTLMVNLDVTDPTNITEKNRMYFVGSYLSSRMVDGGFLLTYHYNFSLEDVNFEDPSTFVPQYGTPGNMTCIPGDAIVCPEDATTSRYTVICKLDGDSLEVEGTAALLSYSQELYVSEDTIYATYSYTENFQVNTDAQFAAYQHYRQAAMTQITGISYTGDSLQVLGSVVVEGTVKNQYSMDQYEGVLRVVTSTTDRYFREAEEDDWASVTSSGTKRNVNLYCINLKNWQIAAELIAFAPNGEDAQSVRFDGPNAYVCTAEVITLKDPVYFFDLSDLDNITWTDTGTIDGYSTSLIQLGDGYLLGVGYGTNRHLKIEVYEECADAVVGICAYERNVSFSTEYKSYLVDRENDLFGLAVTVRDYNTGRVHYEYVLLHFDGYQLNEVTVVDLSKNYNDLGETRAFIADGWLYILTSHMNEIIAHQVW